MPTSFTPLVKALHLESHPEGGFFRETYRSAENLKRSGGDRRSVATSILYLLPAGARSRWHRIKSDEVWNYHLGGPLQLCEIAPSGRAHCTLIGPVPSRRQALQHVVPAGSWFAAKPSPGTRFTLVGCVVAPGFDFRDFELADPDQLVRTHPRLAPLIRRYA